MEADFSWDVGLAAKRSARFVAIIKICHVGEAAARFSPLRFGDIGGKPFASEADGLLAGYEAGRRMVDDLLTSWRTAQLPGYVCVRVKITAAQTLKGRWF